MASIAKVPIEKVFKDSWLDPSLVLRRTEAELLAYVHWTRPNYFGGRQSYYSAIGLLNFELASGAYYLLGIVGKSSKRDPWGPSVAECGDQGASSLPLNHLFFLVRPNDEEVSAFAKAWDFDKRVQDEVVMEQFSAFKKASDEHARPKQVS
jgi:hypothetical protein